MKIYVAGASSGWEYSKELMGRLEAHGHTITYDWTEVFEDPVSLEIAKDSPDLVAQECIGGVQEADALVALVEPGRISTGLWCEMGMALGMGKPVCAYIPVEVDSDKQSQWIQQQVFLFSPRVGRVRRFKDLLKWLTLTDIHWKEFLTSKVPSTHREPHCYYTQKVCDALEVLFEDSSVTWPTTVDTLKGVLSGIEQMIDIGQTMASCEVAA